VDNCDLENKHPQPRTEGRRKRDDCLFGLARQISIKRYGEDSQMLSATPEEIERVSEYMRSQAPDLTVEVLQKVYSENVLHLRHDVWDVHTNVDRWWVITQPMNLYSQEQFPNMDLALTFHVGLCLRIPRSERQKQPDIPAEPFAACLRGLQEASEALAQTQEVADCQSIRREMSRGAVGFRQHHPRRYPLGENGRAAEKGQT
jgi:hypothetical protein